LVPGEEKEMRRVRGGTLVLLLITMSCTSILMSANLIKISPVSGGALTATTLLSGLGYPKGLWVKGDQVYLTETAGRNTVFGGNVSLDCYNVTSGKGTVLIDHPTCSDAVVVAPDNRIYLTSYVSSTPGEIGDVSVVDPTTMIETHLVDIAIASEDMFIDPNNNILIIGMSDLPDAKSIYLLPSGSYTNPVVLQTGLGRCWSITEIGDYTYYSAGSSGSYSINFFSNFGGSIEPFWTGSHTLNSMSFGSGYLYYADFLGGTVGRIDIQTKTEETLLSGLNEPACVRYDQSSGRLYFLEAGTDFMQYKDGTLKYIDMRAPSITLSETSGLVGDSVTVAGSRFDSYETITMRFWSGDYFEYLPSSTSDGSGSFVTSFVVPASTAGSHRIDAFDTSGQGASASFTVTPSIVLGVGSGTVGSYLAISGSGFGANSWITINYDGESLYDPAFSTGPRGDFYAWTYVPASVAGPHTVSAIDVPGNTATATFTVTPSITLSPSGGVIPCSTTVTGSGFAASKAITITYNSVTQVTSGSSDPYGSFVTSFTVPASAAGSYPVLASDSVNSASATFTVGVPGCITILNVLQGGSTLAPPSSWSYTIAEQDTGNVVDTFQLPAGGGGSHAFAASISVDYVVTAIPKYGYDTTVYGDAGIGYSHVYSVGGEGGAIPYEEGAYLDTGGWATITFTNSLVGAFANQALTQAPPSGGNFSIPANQPWPVQSAWNATLKNDGRLDLVVNKTMAIVVNFTQTLTSDQYANISVTFAGTTKSRVVSQSALAQDSVVVFSPFIPKTIGNTTISGTYQIGNNPNTWTGTPNALTSTSVTVKDTSILYLAFFALNNSAYGGTATATDIADFVGNATTFINATYPVKNVAITSSIPAISGNSTTKSTDYTVGLANDCKSIWVAAQLSTYGKSTIGIGIAPNNRNYQDYFTYMTGSTGGVGYTASYNCKGVIVLAGYYTAAAHEVGHLSKLYWPPTSEEYAIYPKGLNCSGIWPDKNQWRNGTDIMWYAYNRTLDYAWIDSSTYLQLLSKTRVTSTDPPILVVSGLIYKNGTVSTDNWYQLASGIPTDGIVPGNYLIECLDANGKVLSTTSFDAPFTAQIDPGTGVGQNMPDPSQWGAVQTDVSPFAFSIPYTPGTVSALIVNATDPNNPINMTTIQPSNIVYVPPPANLAPTITAPPDVTVPANTVAGATGVALGSPTVNSPYFEISDLTVTNDAPSVFPIGTTIVTWTVTDPNGLAATATQKVTVYVSIRFTTSGMGSDTGTATVLTIDNTPYSFSQLQSLSFNWMPGSTHTVTVSTPVAGTLWDQYVFLNWTNGNTLNGITGTYTVPSANSIVTANFKTQYQLTVTINPAGLAPKPCVTPSGTGSGGTWYDANTVVKLTASPIALNKSSIYTFNYWVVDGTLQKQGTLQITIKMNQSHTTIANYAHFVMNAFFTDSNQKTITSFTCLTTPNSEGGYTISATNPATFYYNLQVTNKDPSGTFSLVVLVPSDFAITPISPGVSPVQINGKAVTYSFSMGLLIVSNVPISQNQMVTLTVHLKYAKTTSSKATFSTPYPFVATVNLVQLSTTTITAVGTQMSAIGGFITDGNGAPRSGLTVTITTTSGSKVATCTTANDGFYFAAVPAGTYTVTVNAQNANVAVTQNKFTEQDFLIK
jgi:hypothetical protein